MAVGSFRYGGKETECDVSAMHETVNSSLQCLNCNSDILFTAIVSHQGTVLLFVYWILDASKFFVIVTSILY